MQKYNIWLDYMIYIYIKYKVYVVGFRLYDTQNNDRGGYNVGSVYYYGTSVLQVEW